jgi:hypothetical protein
MSEQHRSGVHARGFIQGRGESRWILVCQGNPPGVVVVGDRFAWHDLGRALIVEIDGRALVCSIGKFREPFVFQIHDGAAIQLGHDARMVTLWGDDEIGDREARLLPTWCGVEAGRKADELVSLFDPDEVESGLSVLVADLNPYDRTFMVSVEDARTRLHPNSVVL